MEALDKGIVQNEHDGGEPPSPSFVPEEHLTHIAHIFDFGMSEAEFPTIARLVSIRQAREMRFKLFLPDSKRGVQNQASDDNGQDQTRHQAEDGVRVWE